MRTLKKPSYLSSPAEAIRYVVEEGGYGDVAKGKFPNHSARLDDLEALAQFALAYDDVGRFLEEVTLYGDPSGEDRVAGEEDDERLVLSYFADIESQTVMYLRDLLRGNAGDTNGFNSLHGDCVRVASHFQRSDRPVRGELSARTLTPVHTVIAGVLSAGFRKSAQDITEWPLWHVPLELPLAKVLRPLLWLTP